MNFNSEPTEEYGGLLGILMQQLRGRNHYMQNKGGPVDSKFTPNVSDNLSGGSFSSGLPSVGDYNGGY
tara:strand:- start:15345 stop:15548 length:204 start_codon:yes stop_codon:yes gene_type:complete